MEDQLGFSLIYIQAKKWALDAVVGQPDIQSFVGAIAGKHGHGLFVTTAHFSKQALVSSRVGYNETLPLYSETLYRNPETLARSIILTS